MSNLEELLWQLESQSPQFMNSVSNSKKMDSDLFYSLGSQIIESIVNSFPDIKIADLARIYAEYTMEQNLLQARYMATGQYPIADQNLANAQIYQNSEVMTEYMLALKLTQFLWPHHLSILRFYLDQFVNKMPTRAINILEMAPGHGFFGRKALEARPLAILEGIDISPTAIQLTKILMKPFVNAYYFEGDALAPVFCKREYYDYIIAGELLEHVDQPELVFRSVRAQLRNQNSRAFVTAAITAANMDHVFEFTSSDQVREMLYAENLELVADCLAFPPSADVSSARFPRVYAMVLKKGSPQINPQQ